MSQPRQNTMRGEVHVRTWWDQSQGGEMWLDHGRVDWGQGGTEWGQHGGRGGEHDVGSQREWE